MAATPSTRLEPASRDWLLRTAAIAIGSSLAGDSTAPPAVSRLPPGLPELQELRASFVTLTIAGDLRGCCGTLEPRLPLAVDVWTNARSSAFRDPRFLPLGRHEWQQTRLEVAVLTPSERLTAEDETGLLAQLVPGEHGLVLAWRGSRATFLPKVWEQLPDPRDFLRHLKLKAGWNPAFWATDIEIWRYRTEVMAVDSPAQLAAVPP
jgi:AmmeMemoRadiSam system protein A